MNTEHHDEEGRQMTDIKERKLLICGGNGGIGRAIVKRLARFYSVWVIDRNHPSTVQSDVTYRQIDLDTRDGIARLQEIVATEIKELYGIINVAAIARTGPLNTMPTATWEQILRTNLHMPIHLIQCCDRYLNEGGRIIMFGSGTVFKGLPNLAAYVASKAGVIGLVRSLAAEYGARKITVNTVCPGMTNTPMIEEIKGTEPDNIATRCIKRREEPEDLVGIVEFLLSDRASFITGQSIVVDGGSVRR